MAKNKSRQTVSKKEALKSLAKKDLIDTIVLLSVISSIAVIVIVSAIMGYGSDLGLANPASVYCENQGYTLEFRETVNGTLGFCVFDDGTECEEWAYYRGECERGICIIRENGVVNMSRAEALAIAIQSECMNEGTLAGNYYCNPVTGTWWVDLDVPDPGSCNPACVINISSGSAEINWRCTGLIEE